MAPKVLSRVIHGPTLPLSTTIPSTLHTRPALLPAHRRHRVRSADYPAILPHAGSTVRGTLVSGLTDGDMWRLDIFEGNEYERVRVEVRELGGDVGDGEPAEELWGERVQAETYVWVAPREQLEEGEWDFKEFVRERMWRWTGEAGEERSDYRDVDEAVEAEKNGSADPLRGRGLDGAIGKAVEESREKEQEVLKSAV